jgi:hypothetical protein
VHAAVRAAFAEMADVDLVTHGYVVAESLAVVLRRFGVDGAIALLDDILPVVESSRSSLTCTCASRPATGTPCRPGSRSSIRSASRSSSATGSMQRSQSTR